jgi:hypothetical protein
MYEMGIEKLATVMIRAYKITNLAGDSYRSEKASTRDDEPSLSSQVSSQM